MAPGTPQPVECALPRKLGDRFCIGDHPWHIERTTSSLIDEVRVYDRALSPQHIAAHAEGLIAMTGGPDGRAYERAPQGFDVPPVPDDQLPGVGVQDQVARMSQTVAPPERLEFVAAHAPGADDRVGGANTDAGTHKDIGINDYTHDHMVAKMPPTG